MSGKYRPLTAREVRHGLKKLGFVQRPSQSTSHEQWVKDVKKVGRMHRYKVTVTAHHAPFHRTLLQSMIRQAGVSKEGFYKACEAIE